MAVFGDTGLHRGYFKVWRKIEDSGLYQMPNTLALFMFMLSKAMHKDCKVGTSSGVVELVRGQYISGRKQLAADLKLTEREIRTSLSRLIELQIIDQQTTSKYSIYTIVNYGKYQDCDQQTTSTVTSKRPANDQQTTTKEECKNDKNVSKHNTTAAAFALPDWIDADDWSLWIKTRKGKKMLPEQMQAQVEKLRKWKDSGLPYAQSLADSASNGWQGLFEPKVKFKNSQDSKLDVVNQIMGDRNGANRQIRDITTQCSNQGDRARIPEIIDGVWQSDGG